MSGYTDQEIAGWNSHRARQRAPYVSADRPTPPYELRRKSRRERTPHNKAIHDFALAMEAAEKPRSILKKRFGYNDKQIGSLTLAYNRRRRAKRPA